MSLTGHSEISGEAQMRRRTLGAVVATLRTQVLRVPDAVADDMPWEAVRISREFERRYSTEYLGRSPQLIRHHSHHRCWQGARL